MAIVDPAAVRYSNEKLRVAADKMVQAYYHAKDTVNEWYALNMGTMIVNDDSAILEDGAYNGDGRKVVSGAELTHIVVRCEEFIDDMEAGSNAKLNTLLNVSVNNN